MHSQKIQFCLNMVIWSNRWTCTLYATKLIRIPSSQVYLSRVNFWLSGRGGGGGGGSDGSAAVATTARCASRVTALNTFGRTRNFFVQLSVLIESKFSAFCGERASHARFPNSNKLSLLNYWEFRNVRLWTRNKIENGRELFWNV